MNAQEIRELAIERVAEADWKNVGYRGVYPVWASVPEEQKRVWRRGARDTVDALGDLLPTIMEEQRGEGIYRVNGGEHVREMHRRYVTDWTSTMPSADGADL